MFLRAALLAFCMAAIGWSVTVGSISWEALIVEPLGRRVMFGDSVKISVLDRLVEQMPHINEAKFDRAAYRRAMAAIHSSRVQWAMQNASGRLDGMMGVLDKATTDLLSISPIEPYFWLSRYQFLNLREGFTPRASDSLAMSYRTGPYEGWISLVRNRFALAIFLELPEAMRSKVATEFAGMVQSWMIGPASANLETVGWPNRDELLRQLDSVPIAQKTNLATTLQRDGFTVDVPGVETRDPRPWH